MKSEAYQKYKVLQTQLIDLISQNKGESQEADALRDHMDGPWYAMTEEERQEFYVYALGSCQ